MTESLELVELVPARPQNAKFAQPLPWHRSMSNPVSFVELSCQASRIQVPNVPVGVAVRLDGAVGGNGFTTMEIAASPKAPVLSPTLRVAVYVPAVLYTWVIRDPVPDAPSPNDHVHEFTVPWGAVDAEPSKVTLRGTTPVEGVAEMTACAMFEICQHVTRAS